MVRNPDYALRGLPYLDRVEVLGMRDNQSMITAFRGGQLDIQGTGIDRPAKDTITKEIPKVQVYQAPGIGTGIELGFKADKPPFDNVKVRQAVSKAIDRQAFLDTIYSGEGTFIPAFSLPGADWILPQTELKQLLKRDLDGAKQLLQEAGVTNLSFELSVANFGEASVAGAELIQAQLKEAGITARIKLLSGTEYNQVVVA